MKTLITAVNPVAQANLAKRFDAERFTLDTIVMMCLWADAYIALYPELNLTREDFLAVLDIAAAGHDCVSIANDREFRCYYNRKGPNVTYRKGAIHHLSVAVGSQAFDYMRNNTDASFEQGQFMYMCEERTSRFMEAQYREDHIFYYVASPVHACNADNYTFDPDEGIPAVKTVATGEQAAPAEVEAPAVETVETEQAAPAVKAMEVNGAVANVFAGPENFNSIQFTHDVIVMTQRALPIIARQFKECNLNGITADVVFNIVMNDKPEYADQVAMVRAYYNSNGTGYFYETDAVKYMTEAISNGLVWYIQKNYKSLLRDGATSFGLDENAYRLDDYILDNMRCFMREDYAYYKNDRNFKLLPDAIPAPAFSYDDIEDTRSAMGTGEIPDLTYSTEIVNPNTEDGFFDAARFTNDATTLGLMCIDRLSTALPSMDFSSINVSKVIDFDGIYRVCTSSWGRHKCSGAFAAYYKIAPNEALKDQALREVCKSVFTCICDHVNKHYAKYLRPGYRSQRMNECADIFADNVVAAYLQLQSEQNCTVFETPDVHGYMTAFNAARDADVKDTLLEATEDTGMTVVNPVNDPDKAADFDAKRFTENAAALAQILARKMARLNPAFNLSGINPLEIVDLANAGERALLCDKNAVLSYYSIKHPSARYRNDTLYYIAVYVSTQLNDYVHNHRDELRKSDAPKIACVNLSSNELNRACRLLTRLPKSTISKLIKSAAVKNAPAQDMPAPVNTTEQADNVATVQTVDAVNSTEDTQQAVEIIEASPATTVKSTLYFDALRDQFTTYLASVSSSLGHALAAELGMEVKCAYLDLQIDEWVDPAVLSIAVQWQAGQIDSITDVMDMLSDTPADLIRYGTLDEIEALYQKAASDIIRKLHRICTRPDWDKPSDCTVYNILPKNYPLDEFCKTVLSLPDFDSWIVDVFTEYRYACKYGEWTAEAVSNEDSPFNQFLALVTPETVPSKQASPDVAGLIDPPYDGQK